VRRVSGDSDDSERGARRNGRRRRPGVPSSGTSEISSVATEPTAVVPRPGDALGSEAGSLAREMAHAHHQMLLFYTRDLGLSADEALARASGGADIERAETTPADQLDWLTLSDIARVDPERARALWERALDEARDELMSGHRSAKAVETHGGPWQRAQFLAILQAFIDAWEPRGGIEAALIDSLAQAYTSQLFWQARLTVLSSTEAQRQDRGLKQRGEWEPPTVDAAAAIDQAAAMVDRFNRLFARTLRALRDLRRYTPQVVVQNVGQLNLAQSQVNVGQAEPPNDQSDSQR
jgi:hypothetical protein